ncbi:hypothetical protein EBS43_07570 [bacterium]|jgi:hypothetical protein|nr:hypothetical protein [bacterium]
MGEIETQIKNIIQAELKRNLEISNLHGVDLKRCLVEPYQEIFENSFNESELMALYVVLKEDPVNDSGYQIVYDSQRGKFELSIAGKGIYRVFLGYYGSFLETLEGM